MVFCYCVCQPLFSCFFFFKLLGRIQDLFPYLFLGLFFFYFFSWVEDKKVHVLPSSSLGEVGVQLLRAERIVPFTGVSERPPLGLQVVIPRSQPWRQQGSDWGQETNLLPSCSHAGPRVGGGICHGLELAHSHPGLPL